MTIEELEDGLPRNGRVVVTCTDGRISSYEIVRDEQYIASFETLIELLCAAGYAVTKN